MMRKTQRTYSKEDKFMFQLLGIAFAILILGIGLIELFAFVYERSYTPKPLEYVTIGSKPAEAIELAEPVAQEQQVELGNDFSETGTNYAIYEEGILTFVLNSVEFVSIQTFGQDVPEWAVGKIGRATVKGSILELSLAGRRLESIELRHLFDAGWYYEKQFPVLLIK